MKRFLERAAWFLWDKPLIKLVQKSFPGGVVIGATLDDGQIQLRQKSVVVDMKVLNNRTGKPAVFFSL